MIPDQEYLATFVGLVKEMEKTLGENDYIGIHCTHGANRTGYLIIYYMCSELNIDLQIAREAFDKSRAPHGLAKEILIDDLI